jgi:hypothetical protein
MALMKVLNGINVKMTDEEEKELLARQEESRIELEKEKSEILNSKKSELQILQKDLSNDSIICLRPDLKNLITP